MGVDAAVNSIRDNLDQSWTDWDVTEGELKDITSELQDLSPQERNEVISRLSDEELGHWADEVGGWVNGLDEADRQNLLNQLAESLDGRQLERVADAFGVEDVSDAVASRADPQQKLEYIQALQDQADDSPQIDVGFLGGSTTTTDGNAEAHAVAEVLASLDGSPQQFQQAIASLQEAGKLDTVLSVAAGRSSTSYNTGGMSLPNTSYDARVLNDIAAAAAGTDLATRTAVFEAAAGPLREMQGDSGGLGDMGGGNNASADALADGMAQLLTREEAVSAGIVETPTSPPSVSLDANIELAQQHSFPADLGWFYDQVKGGGPWDYKQGGAQYENFGNFNYGMTAAAMGIPEDVALRAAGWAQEQAGTSQDEWGNPYDLGGSYGDDPRDQAQIEQGYEYYNSGLWRVWSD